MKVQQLAALDINQRYSIPEACGYLRISRARLYQKIKAGKIAVIKDGSRAFVPGVAIAAESRPQRTRVAEGAATSAQ